MNARCVSFSLDRIWGKITINHIKCHQDFVWRYLMCKWKSFYPGLVPSEPIGLAFLHLVSYCFYLPLGIMGPLVSSQTYRESFLRTPPPISRWIESVSLTKTLTGPCCNGYFGKHWDIFFGLLSLIWCFSFSSSRFWFTSFFVINQPNHYTILHSIMGAIRSFLQLMPLAYPDINFYNKA